MKKLLFLLALPLVMVCACQNDAEEENTSERIIKTSTRLGISKEITEIIKLSDDMAKGANERGWAWTIDGERIYSENNTKHSCTINRNLFADKTILTYIHGHHDKMNGDTISLRIPSWADLIAYAELTININELTEFYIVTPKVCLALSFRDKTDVEKFTTFSQKIQLENHYGGGEIKEKYDNMIKEILNYYNIDDGTYLFEKFLKDTNSGLTLYKADFKVVNKKRTLGYFQSY